ncbi:MAG: FAD-dependent oxidoreductase [Patescibacteria group bacterium]
MYDLAIIGGGPAGAAAGVYAARKKIKSVLITDFFGGQSLVSADIQNWIGVPSISGLDLGKALENHLRAQEGIEIIEGNFVTTIEKNEIGFSLKTDQNKTIEVKTVLITSGSHHKKLGVPGEEKLNGKGVAFCSTCDAPLFKDKNVAVIGGGNSGLEAVLDLQPYARKIYLLHRSENLKGDPVTAEKIKTDSKATIIFNVEVQKFIGEDSVLGLEYKDKASGAIKKIDVEGIFVEVGSAPNSNFVKNLLDLNKWGEIVVDHKTQRTSVTGIWAAGDVTDVIYKQNNISVGDAIKGVLNIYDFLKLK